MSQIFLIQGDGACAVILSLGIVQTEIKQKPGKNCRTVAVLGMLRNHYNFVSMNLKKESKNTVLYVSPSDSTASSRMFPFFVLTWLETAVLSHFYICNFKKIYG